MNSKIRVKTIEHCDIFLGKSASVYVCRVRHISASKNVWTFILFSEGIAVHMKTQISLQISTVYSRILLFEACIMYCMDYTYQNLV